MNIHGKFTLFLLLCMMAVLALPALPALAEEAAPAPPAEAPPAEAPPVPLTDVRQVQIKVWISETNEQGLRDIGTNLNFTRFVRGEEQSGSVQQVLTNNFTPADNFGIVQMPYPTQTLFGPPLRPDLNNNLADGLQNYRGAGMEFSIIDSGAGTLDGIFQTLERRVDVDLISKPELLVANNAKAVIKAGGQVPYQDVQYGAKNPYTGVRGAPELQVSWRDTGVNLALTPSVLPNDYVQLTIETLEVSDINRIDNLRGVDLPVFSSRSQTGIIYVPDGASLVIGGLTSRVSRTSERRIPVLGNVPLLGIPFRSRRSNAETTSLLVFVSPTVVDLRAPTPQAKSALNFWRERGTEWMNRDRVDRERDAMEEGL